MADGRGRPVLLIPGFLAGDGSLSMMARLAQARRLPAQPRRNRVERELRRNADAAARGAARAARLRAGTAGRDRRPEPRWHARQGARAPPAGPHGRRGGARLAADRPARGASAGAAPGRGRRPAGIARRARALQALVHRRRLLLVVLGGPRRAAAARGGPRLGLLEERRRRGLAVPASIRMPPGSWRSTPPTAGWRCRGRPGARWRRRSRSFRAAEAAAASRHAAPRCAACARPERALRARARRRRGSSPSRSARPAPRSPARAGTAPPACAPARSARARGTPPRPRA